MGTELLPQHIPPQKDADKNHVGVPAPEHLPQVLRFSPELHDAFNDVQRVIENMRSVATRKAMHVIGIASAVPQEGVSTLATMMAIMAAKNSKAPGAGLPKKISKKNTSPRELNGRQQGILLIDAQMRHPSLHEILGVPLAPGLRELLADEVSLADSLKLISTAGLQLITAGQGWLAPFTPINSENLKSHLDQLKPEFEFVFLDLPPLLRAAEGIALSKLCDGVVLVIHAHQTRWEIIAEAKRLLENSGVYVLGGVLNRRMFFIPEKIYRRL